MTLLSANEAVVVGRETARPRLLSLYLELTKARLSALVVLTTGVGFVMATPIAFGIDWWRLALTTIGTALAAGSANAFNQLLERDRDGLMHRTRNRPLPSGALGPGHCLWFAIALAYGGLLLLGELVHPLAAVLALLTILLYVFGYTPLKTRSPLNTVVGAVCGAIPPMIGWVAASGSLDGGAWLLAGLLFLWQIPHFFALAWRYRDDYARGGFAMLPNVDRTGRKTGALVVLASVALLPVGWASTRLGVSSQVFGAGALVLGAGLLALAIMLAARRTDDDARRLFLASIIYLPVLLCLMVVDRATLLP